MDENLSSLQIQIILESIININSQKKLPESEPLETLILDTLKTLQNESIMYREKSSDGFPGGLLNFCSERFNDLPVIIVPDLHGRVEFLPNLLQQNIVPGFEGNVIEALSEGKVIVICVGDGMHGESRVFARWKQSYLEWNNGNILSDSMCAEMAENLCVMQTVMILKNSFPYHFHFLKGNHENIMDEDGGGNYSFRKFALEGEMTREFMATKYGQEILYEYYNFEKNLPVCAVTQKCCVSHGEPAAAFKKKDIINYADNPEVVYGFTWTANDEAIPGSVQKLFSRLNKNYKGKKYIWFGGHRPVDGNFALRQNDSYVQIHNPYKFNVAVVDSRKEFNPELDIISVFAGEETE